MSCIHKLQELFSIKSPFYFLLQHASPVFLLLLRFLALSPSHPPILPHLLLSQFVSGPLQQDHSRKPPDERMKAMCGTIDVQKSALTHIQYKNSAMISVLKGSNFFWRQNQLGRHTDVRRTLCAHLSSFAVSFSLCLAASASLYRNSGTETPPLSLCLQPMTICRDTRLPSSTTLPLLLTFCATLIITTRLEYTMSTVKIINIQCNSHF